MKRNITLSVTIVLLFSIVLFISTTVARADTEIPLTASASSSYSSNTPDKAVDNNLTTYWRARTSWWRSEASWLRLDCGDIYNLSQISIWWHRDYAATNYNIQSSTDGNNWTNLYTGLSSSGGGTNPYLLTYTLSVSARFIRIYINRVEKSYPGIYEVKIYSDNGNQPPTAEAGANPTSGEAPLTVQFSGSGSADPDGNIVGYSWDFGDGGTSTQQDPPHTYQTAGNYTATLTVTDDDGATDDDSVTISVTSSNQPPTTSIDASPTSGKAPLEVAFIGSGTDADGSIVSYAWNFGDGGTSTQQNPIYTYDDPGSYEATLTVTDDDGATDSASVNITVEEPSVTPAEIPHLIRFQARLGDIEETPLSGTFTLTFRLYDIDIGGTPLWEETQDVDVEDGILDVKLGSVTTLDLPFDRQYWLGVEVASDGEASPRFELTTVPYAFRSE